jgi:hypothetical protein
VNSPPVPPRRPRFQFSILAMMVLMMGVGLAFAPAYYLVRAVQGEQNMRLIGTLAVLSAPLLLMIIVSLIVSLARWRNR